MPRIADELLECVFFLYPDKGAALKREKTGGSGFFVHVPLEMNPKWGQVYAVTCRHNILHAGQTPTIRINKKDQTADVITISADKWVQHHYACDVAAAPVELSTTDYGVRFVPLKDFMTEQLLEARMIGPGDDVFMIGRLIGRDGKQKNTPSVRFGNISMMSADPIKDDYGIRQESFVIECRSLPGYSGSPVFLTIDRTQPRPPNWFTPVNHVYRQEWHGPWLLGIDWCHIHDYAPLLDADKEAKSDPKQWTKMNTGMAGVVPAWKIVEVLNCDEFRAQRTNADKDISDKAKLDSEPSSNAQV